MHISPEPDVRRRRLNALRGDASLLRGDDGPPFLPEPCRCSTFAGRRRNKNSKIAVFMERMIDSVRPFVNQKMHT
ncbi:hypothetical protein BMJ27_24450 [Sinorhizobium medicae]|nr:hypothetical protein BMJ27_24450 [Sinorhizobium medicae]